MSHHSVFSIHRHQRSQPTERWAEIEEARSHHNDHQWSAKAWEGRASTHGTKTAQVEVNCGHTDSSLSGKGASSGTADSSPGSQNDCVIVEKMRARRSVGSVLFTSGWQIGFRRKSPLKETNLLLEGFWSTNLVCPANTCLALGCWLRVHSI